MKTTLKIVGVNSILEYLRNKSFDGEIVSFPQGSPFPPSMTLIKDGEKEYLFDVKETQILDKVTLVGILQDGQTTGKAAIEIN